LSSSKKLFRYPGPTPSAARPIADEAAALAASTLAADSVGWRMFQWLQHSLVPDRSVID
jgi:hypothetical protein